MRKPSSRQLEDGLMRLTQARSGAFSARTALASGDDSAERHARRALVQYRAAMDRLEDSPEFEVAHVEMDILGRLCRETWPDGCRFQPVGDDYAQDCPVAHAHTRIGLSPATLGNAICSVCGVDVTTCPHRPGDTVKAVVAARVGDGRCNIDGVTGCSVHEVGSTYDAEVRIIITHVHMIEEISLVLRPAQPNARIQRVTIPRSDFERALGHPLPAGAVPRCDRCLSGCGGLIHPRPTSVD